ncbi:GNAT family N-acetyltransferase [Marmoricola sp. URHB0036]|uniref:GNAT family N-acetyltransferase n=1 Tax=Marmoricola sp. URHB0036 TaxID=1298863 RepID=UPI0004050F93|nr:GNAT family N-acetyltransferase [Marmoricola sp. URHB0036]
MPRQAPRIRDAVPEDAWDLLDLWAAVSGIGDHSSSPDRSLADAEQALATIALDPDQRLLVAEHEDRIVAAMKLSRGPLWPLALDQAVHSSFLLVLPHYRRHGYGHALMEAALAWAEEKDITQITVVTDGNRDTNRFFARLGLGTLGNVRHAHTAALRKKLTTERARSGGNRHLVEVLAQRRSMRRRQGTA